MSAVGKSGCTKVARPDGISAHRDKLTLMKAILPLLIFGGALPPPVRAQLVHRSFKDPGGVFIFRADSAQISWDHARSGKNAWLTVMTSSLGNFVIVRPIQSVTFPADHVEFQDNSEPRSLTDSWIFP